MSVSFLGDPMEVSQRRFELGLLERELHVGGVAALALLHGIGAPSTRLDRVRPCLVFAQHGQRLIGNGRHLGQRIHSVRFRVGQDVEQLPLGWRRRSVPRAAIVTLAMQAFVQESAQFRLARGPERIAKVGQRHTEFVHDRFRRPHQFPVGDHAPWQSFRSAERPDVVDLPQRQPRLNRHPVPRVQRARHFHRAAVDMDAHRRLKQGLPERKQQAKAGFLDEPRPVCIHVEHDVGHRPAIHRLLMEHRLCVEPADAVPVAADAAQHDVVQPPNVLPLPKPLGILLVRPRPLMLRPEVTPH